MRPLRWLTAAAPNQAAKGRAFRPTARPFPESVSGGGPGGLCSDVHGNAVAVPKARNCSSASTVSVGAWDRPETAAENPHGSYRFRYGAAAQIRARPPRWVQPVPLPLATKHGLRGHGRAESAHG